MAIISLIALRYRGLAQQSPFTQWSWKNHSLWAIVYSFYSLLTNLWSASLVNSIQVTLMEISALLLFVLVSQHADRLRKVFVPTFLLAGIALFVYGMGAAVQWWSATDAVYGNHLLASVFEYHNTFGAIMLAVGIVAYFTGTNSTKWWGNLLGSLAFMVAIVGILGSYSRIVWVLAPIAYLASFILKPLMQKTIWPAINGVVLAIVAGGSAVFALKALSRGIGKDFIYCILVLVIGTVVVSLAEKWASKRHLSGKMLISSLMALAVVVFLLAILFRHHLLVTTSSITARLSSISLNSVSLQERFVYYHNALRMWENAPLFGSGGGTWDAKFQSFQTIPYWSTEVHSNVMDHLLNGGIIGFGLWIVLLVFLVRSLICALRDEKTMGEERLYRVGFAFAGLFLFGHAVFDFDFAFGYFQYIFWIFMALAVAPYRKNEEIPSGVPGIAMLVLTWVTGVLTALLGISLGASQIFGQLASSAGPVGNQGDTHLAALWAPYDPNLQLTLAQIDLQSIGQGSINANAWSHVQSAASYGAWNPTVQTQAAVIAYQLHHMSQAVAWADRAYQDAPYNSIVIRNMLGIKLWDSISLMKTNPTLANTQLQDIVNKYNDFSTINKGINYKLFADATPVQIDASMQVYIGTADYFLRNYQASLEVMNHLSTANRDQSAVNLYNIITVLDHQQMHVKPTPLDQALMQQIKMNPMAMSEYRYIVNRSK